MTILTGLLAAALAATVEVPAGGSLEAAVAGAGPGDVIRLGPGRHSGSLGRLSGVRIEGAGAEATQVVAPEGQDGAVVTGRVELSGLAITAGPARSALKVLGGEAILRDVRLVGEAAGAFVDGGRLEARGVTLTGRYGLLQADGEADLRDVVVLAPSGARAGLAVLRGRLTASRGTVTGPFAEAGITVSSGSARLEELVVRAPGPTGLAVARGAISGRDVEVAGARELAVQGGGELDAVLGDCVQVRRGTLELSASGLSRCGGAALTASGGTVRLVGVDAQGGSAGALLLLDGARAELDGNWITGRGPALVAAGGSEADATFNRWRADPVFWVECGSGARVILGFGEHHPQPCAAKP